MKPASPESTQLFHRLHQEGLLLLTNVWDAGSARLFESVGAPALATTSAGVAWAHGYSDGDRLPVNVLAASIAEITRVIRIPLSVDMEGGYSSDPATVGENVAAIVGAGAVGINLEDGNGDPDLLCAKIEYAKSASSRLGVNLFINARTDGYLTAAAPSDAQLEEVLKRAARYRGAGADGLFVPGVTDPATIKRIVAEANLPLNVLARAALPAAPALIALGVRRLSAGSGILQALYGKASTLATDFLHTGVSSPLTAGAMAYRDINSLFDPR